MSMGIVCMVKEDNTTTKQPSDNVTLSPDELECGTLEDEPTYEVRFNWAFPNNWAFFWNSSWAGKFAYFFSNLTNFPAKFAKYCQNEKFLRCINSKI